jgi:hypothetical protein
MGMWTGIATGLQAVEERREREEDREFKRRAQERLDKEFDETRLLRRSKSVLDYLDGRGAPLAADSASLSYLKTKLGNVEGANDYLAKLMNAPGVAKTVADAIRTRENNLGIQLTGEDVFENIQIVAEGYGDESFLAPYREGRDIYKIATGMSDDLLDDEYFGKLMGRVSDLPSSVAPTVYADIAPGFTAEIDAELQADIFDDKILEYAEYLKTNESVEDEYKIRIDAAVKAHTKGDKTTLRNMLGGYVSEFLLAAPGAATLFPALAPNLSPYQIPSEAKEALVAMRETNSPDLTQAKIEFDKTYGFGAADLILGR